jgi:CxxC-x17-CxxC domain-containing protein
MSSQEKTLHCTDCGTDFSFTAEEQEFYKSKGYTNEPKRCPSCREARKTERGGSRGSSFGQSREMFTATCAQCGKDAKVPFEPTSGRPVYCSDCYKKIRPGR